MIHFSKYIWLYVLISAFVLVPGIMSLVLFGLRPSIDFTGGTLLEVTSSADVTAPAIESIARSQKFEVVDARQDQSILVRMKPAPPENVTRFEKDVRVLASDSATILRMESVGPVLGNELLIKAGIASGIAILGILLFVAYTFRNVTFGISAVVALIHDVLVVFGSFSLLGHFWGIEVDTLFVTAFLTTMSFSVHDTIVVFDRIREYEKRGERLTFSERCDLALTETMGRSVTNSLTICFMLLALVLLGGETIRWFAVALLIGTISGTYSSPFVATPVLIFLSSFKRSKSGSR
ncbi:MAG: Protein translocase subunit SecF [Candidatus Curtissbacteria bacterium GW2011_GWA1_41_11]|uniref:Protein-export membrane protein SecF n=1 Tax=Candidatus Curtissbacteria bacterium GW2011_GWA1_41_11 TaxID=1618409 RepID=A0A0G0UIL9_9BACT|nr:MAG: Protein translocase subunit SecF [Candidatus Curtissbacteria bacterium GW2011_GWA1_41_11]